MKVKIIFLSLLSSSCQFLRREPKDLTDYINVQKISYSKEEAQKIWAEPREMIIDTIKSFCPSGFVVIEEKSSQSQLQASLDSQSLEIPKDFISFQCQKFKP